MNEIKTPAAPAAFSDPRPQYWAYTADQMQAYAIEAIQDYQRQLSALTEDYKDLEAQLVAVGAGGVSKLMGDQE